MYLRETFLMSVKFPEQTVNGHSLFSCISFPECSVLKEWAWRPNMQRQCRQVDQILQESNSTSNTNSDSISPSSCLWSGCTSEGCNGSGSCSLDLAIWNLTNSWAGSGSLDLSVWDLGHCWSCSCGLDLSIADLCDWCSWFCSCGLDLAF